MIRRFAYLLKHNRNLTNHAIRCMSETPKPTDPKPETSKQQEIPEEEDPSKYEDYGDVKIRRGGRNIKVDENEYVQASPIKKGFNAVTAGFRLVWWGSIAYLAYTLYDYKTNPDKKPTNTVDEYFLEGAKYVDKSYRKVIDLFTKPPSDKLLPEIPVEMYPPGFDFPKTLLINLSGTTIHSNFQMGKGRELIKRPGLDELIKIFSQRCEIVIFSDDDLYLLQNLYMKLDPSRQRISYVLGSESMSLEGGKRVKDLKYINRDPKKVIVLENDPSRLPLQPENGIFIPTFEGNLEDTEIFKLIPFLEYLSHPQVKDVREELKKYGNHNPGEKFLQEIEKRKAALSQRRTGGFGGFLGGAGAGRQQGRAPAS